MTIRVTTFVLAIIAAVLAYAAVANAGEFLVVAPDDTIITVANGDTIADVKLKRLRECVKIYDIDENGNDRMQLCWNHNGGPNPTVETPAVGESVPEDAKLGTYKREKVTGKIKEKKK